MMSRHALLLLAASLLFVTPAAARAQACLGLPARAHSTVALAFEGTDALTGRSAAFMHGRSDWGMQLRLERYDDRPTWRDPWYGAELQLSRAPIEARRCVTTALRYQHDATAEQRYQRLRWPVGLSFGRAFVAHVTQTGATDKSALTITPFVQPQVLLQHERLRPDPAGATTTRTSVAAAATFGFGLGGGPGILRTSVHYATLPEETLNHRHNWFELTMQFGLTF